MWRFALLVALMVLWAAPAPAQPSGTLVFGTLIQAFSYSAPLEDLRLKK